MHAKTKPWGDYPIGAKAIDAGGGHWIKTTRGWKWPGGNTFPTPGGSAIAIELPEEEYCNYPDCKCPFDAPAEPNWCARRLNHVSA